MTEPTRAIVSTTLAVRPRSKRDRRGAYSAFIAKRHSEFDSEPQLFQSASTSNAKLAGTNRRESGSCRRAGIHGVFMDPAAERCDGAGTTIVPTELDPAPGFPARLL